MSQIRDKNDPVLQRNVTWGNLLAVAKIVDEGHPLVEAVQQALDELGKPETEPRPKPEPR